MRVTVRTDAPRYAATFEAKRRELLRGVAATLERVESVALERAYWWSSGPYKQRTLTALDHPYARRHVSTVTRRGKTKSVRGLPIGVGFPARINVQSGRYREGWRTTKRGRGNTVSVTLSNATPYAQYLTAAGTSLMIGRPVLNRIAAAVRTKTRPLWLKTHRDAVRASAVTSVGGPNLIAAFQRGFKLGAGLGGL